MRMVPSIVMSCRCAQVLSVPNMRGRPDHVMWDQNDPTVFVVAEAGSLNVFVYHPVTITGERLWSFQSHR